jgi:GNAT superfamily N-acetyltransferase
MIVRGRRHDELDACVSLLAVVHGADGYPLQWPADPARWLTPEALLAAWVAEDAAAVIGHVALCRAAGEAAAPLWSAACGLAPERFAAITRLFVAPGARGRGVGARLLPEASREARQRELRPALAVLDHDRAAMALYERAGWLRVASVPASSTSPSEGHVWLHAYVAPAPQPEIQVRRAAPEDAPTIAAVLRAAFAEYAPLYTPGGLAATTPSADLIAARFAEGPVWVAVRDGAVVATVAAVPRAGGVYVRSMAALPEARGHGAGQRLLAEIERYAAERGAERLFLSTTPFLARAIRLYEAAGFRHTDAPPHELFGTPLVTMVKQLGTPQDT